jgi:hypothetical protein
MAPHLDERTNALGVDLHKGISGKHLLLQVEGKKLANIVPAFKEAH